MLADVLNSVLSIKSPILYLFETYLGIKLDIANFSLDQENIFNAQLTNIKLEPNIINNKFLKDINIKITKGMIEKLELRLGIDTLEIKISKLSLSLMPVISINNEKNEEIKIDEEKEEKKEELKNNKPKEKEEKEQKGRISSLIENLLSKLKVSIDEIELIAFNYEITNKNLTLANPVICFNIYKIKYDKGKMKENLDKSYIRKNIWENKHFSIDAFCLKISKSFNPEDKDINKSDITTKKKFYDMNNNDNIMVINTEKGIHFYTNTKNEILGEVGDMQLIINLFQLELFKNFIDSYLTYLNLGKEPEKKDSKQENSNENINNTNIDYSNINKSVINNASNNEIMNLSINLKTFSLIILERNQNPTEVKLNEYSKDKMNEHFCYFEDNFFLFYLYNVSLQYSNKKNLTSLTIEEIGLNYIEYSSKEKKEEEIELVKRTGSEMSDNSNIGIFRNNEIFESIAEDGINVKEYYCSYDYRYDKNQILLIKNVKFEFTKGLKDKNKIYFELNSLVCNFHPIYLFKVLKLLYENSFLIKEVLFYNYDQINEEKKLNKGKDKPDENILIENDEDETGNKNGKENGDNLNISFLSVEEKEEEEDNDNSKENNITNNAKNIVYNSDLLFGNVNNENINPETDERISTKIKKIFSSLIMEIKIKVIELKVFSFKCEENFYNIINPFFNEFYFEHIYIMDIKDDFKQTRLKINEISSKDYFSIMIKNINIKNISNEDKNEFLIVKFYPLIISFSNNKILECFSDTFPIKFDLEKNEIDINIKINIFFKVKLFPYILSFVNIWKYTLLLFSIFQQRMIFNYDKGKNELEQMNYERDTLKYIEDNRNKKNKASNLSENNNNIINRGDCNILNVDIKIPLIRIEFDIITSKIKTFVNIKDTRLKCILNKLSNIINFSIKEIDSKEFDFKINAISLNLAMSQIEIENIDNQKLKSKNKKHRKNMNFNIVSPGESIEIYIENILRFKQKQKSLELNNEIKTHETKTDIDISIKEIKINPVESVLFLNDMYNVITREEIYNNSNNEKNKMLLSKSMQRISSSSYGSSNHKNKISILSIKQSVNSNNIKVEPNNKNSSELLNINFHVETIKCIIVDDTTFRNTELSINNINLKDKIFNIKNIQFYILYEIDDFGEKVLVDLCQINDINLSITEKEKNNMAYKVIISSIKLSFCKDSLKYIETVLDIVSDLISNCFVQAKKGNKIVITQKKDKLLGMRDTRMVDEQEAEVFGNDEAKSVCLTSQKNEFELDIEENYLDNLINEQEEVLEVIDQKFKSDLRMKKKENNEDSNLNLCIKKIDIGLYAGFDFESVVDIKCKTDNGNQEQNKKEEEGNIIILQNDSDDDNININEELNKNKGSKSNEKDNNFEIIEFNPYKKINGRERDNFLLFTTEEINLSILFVQNTSYEVEFNINKFEILDNLTNSKFKLLLFQKNNINIENDKEDDMEDNIDLDIEENNNQKFLSVFVDVSNSRNQLSANNYSDFNIICEISLSSLQLLIDQNSLLFILNFFIEDDKSQSNKEKGKDETKLKLYNIGQYHTERAFIEDIEFNEIILDDITGSQSDLLVDRTFYYITNFLFRKFNVNITYESSDLGFSFQNIYIPLIPNLKEYDFPFKEIKYKGFVTKEKFTDFFVEHFLGQLSKSNIIFQLLKSLSWTQPIINIFGDFFDIFISPFQSYKRNQGFMRGLFKGVKKFFFNLLSKNVYVGEKLIRTLTTFIGVTKSNNIGRNSFYERYILTDEKKKIYDYFYK